MAYLDHFNTLYNKKTFERKINYIKYNYFSQIKDLSKKDFCLLEIGPGLGELIYLFNKKGVSNIDVLDNDKSILTRIKKNYKVKNIFLTSDLSTVDGKLKKYDLIMLTQVLEHISPKKYIKIIQILFSHLKEKGLIIITVPNAGNPLSLTERYSDITHKSAFTENSLSQLVSLSEIKNYELKLNGFKIPPYTFINIVRIFFQKSFHIILLLLNIINGGVYGRIYTPNLTLIIKKNKDSEK